MQPTEIKTGKDTILVVKVPRQDAKNFRIFENKLVYNFGLFASFTETINLPTTINQSSGNWKIVGPSNELTEDQWKEVVPDPLDSYDDYSGTTEKVYIEFFGGLGIFETATESGRSLLIANRFFDKNPYGEKEPNSTVIVETTGTKIGCCGNLTKYGSCCGNGIPEPYQDYSEDINPEWIAWQEAEERTGRFIILIKQS